MAKKPTDTANFKKALPAGFAAQNRSDPAAKRKQRTGASDMQKCFIDEYLKFPAGDMKGLVAAFIRAGYSPRTADTNAYHCFHRPQVQAYLKQKQAKKEELNTLTIQRVIGDLARIAASAEDEGAFQPAIRALELLGKHLGMFVEKTESTISIAPNDSDELDAEILRLLKISKVAPPSIDKSKLN